MAIQSEPNGNDIEDKRKFSSNVKETSEQVVLTLMEERGYEDVAIAFAHFKEKTQEIDKLKTGKTTNSSSNTGVSDSNSSNDGGASKGETYSNTFGSNVALSNERINAMVSEDYMQTALHEDKDKTNGEQEQEQPDKSSKEMDGRV